MQYANSYFVVVVSLAVISGVIIAILRWRKLLAADSRIECMMVSCGIDAEIADYNRIDQNTRTTCHSGSALASLTIW